MYSGRRRGSWEMYVELEAYLDLGTRQRSCFNGYNCHSYA